MPAPKLTPSELALHQAASASLDECQRRWKEINLPPSGKAGLLLAEFFRVCLFERGMSLEDAIDDILDCITHKLAAEARERGSN